MRKYPVDLPFTVPAWAVNSLVNVLVANDVWRYLTPKLGKRINDAVRADSDLILTREETGRGAGSALGGHRKGHSRHHEDSDNVGRF